MKLPLDGVKVDPELQLRDGLDMDRVKAMAEFEEEGGHLPPITVVGDDNLLADGHHRLYVAHTMGRVDIDANRVPGDKADAIAVALNRNDTAQGLPLSRTQRNAGINRLLDLGWSQTRIAQATGISQRTVSNISSTRTIRATLSPEANALKDTMVTRLASLPEEQRPAFADAVAAAGINEPRVREAIKAIKAGASIEEAVADVTPASRPTPKTMSDVARQAYQRLDDFLNATMTVEGRPLDFWQVLDVIAAQHDTVSPPAINTLVDRLSEVSVRTDQYASKLRNGVLQEVAG